MSPTAIYAFALGLYFTIMIMVGIYHVWKIKSSDEYLIAAWNVGFWQIVGTTVATWSGAAVFIGFVGMGFETGLGGFFFWVLPGSLMTIVFVFFFGRILRRMRLYTIPDLFAVRFGKNAALLPALFQILVYAIPTLAIQFIGLGITFQVFFGLDLQWGIVLSFALIAVYTLLGGLPSTILTDCIQSAVIVLALILMFIFGLNYAGGLDEIIAKTPPSFWHPFGPDGLSSFLSLALTVGPFYMVWQTTWQRIFASKDEGTAVKAVSWGFVLCMLIGLLSICIGLFARGYVPLGTQADLVFTTAVSKFFPPLVGAIVVMGLAAALMSGADSFTMMGSASIARDIYQQYFKPQASSREMLIVSRWSVVFMSVAALCIALVGRGIIPVYILVVKICGAGMVFPVFALMLWKRTTRKGVLAGMLAGGLVTVGWSAAGNPWMPEAVPGYLASLFVLVVVSLLTRHAPDEQVRAAYFEPLDVEEYNRRFKSETPVTR